MSNPNHDPKSGEFAAGATGGSGGPDHHRNATASDEKKLAPSTKLPGIEHVAQRIDNAHRDMQDALMNIAGISRPDASKAIETFKQVKAIKVNIRSGKFDVKNGAFLEPDVIRRAVKGVK